MLRSLFRKKAVKYKETIKMDGTEYVQSSRSFYHTIQLAEIWLEEEKNVEDKIVLLDYLLTVIREDLQTDILTTIIYSKEHFKGELPTLMFPYYYDKEGKNHKVNESETPIKVVDLATDCVLVMPWRRDKLKTAIKELKNKVFSQSGNHIARYYSHIDVCYVYNGLHSTGAAIGHKKGKLKAYEVDVSKLFDHLHTDGEYWYNSHTNETYKMKVFDFRFAILYELAKMKYRLEESVSE